MSLPVDIPADSVLCAKHLRRRQGDKGESGSVEQSDELMGHRRRDTHLQNCIPIERAQGCCRFKTGIPDAGDAAAGQHCSGKPNNERNQKRGPMRGNTRPAI